MSILNKNLIIISIDNLRADCVGFDSKFNINIPILNRFVREGIFFDNCIATAPYTTNAHASLLTGFWPYNHGVIDFFSSKLEKPTILKILKAVGYKTLWQTDFSFLLGDKLGFTDGIDKFVAGSEADSYAWLEENKRNNTACFFHFANVHDPYGFVDFAHSGKAYAEKVESLLNKYNLEKENTAYPGQHYLLNEKQNEADLILKQNYRRVINYLHEQEKYDEIMELYIEGLNYFDQNRLAKFINNLEMLGVLQNSLVVIAGDHGEVWDQDNQGHNKGNGKNGLIDELLKVPVIFWQKGFQGSFKISKQIRSIDVVPTCLSILGLDNNKFDGTDLSDFSAISNDLPAYSQLWETDSALVTIFMNQVNKAGVLKKPEFLSSLVSAAIRQNGFSLLDYYPKSGKAQSVFLKNNQKIKNPEEFKDILDVFRRRLDDYNEKTRNKFNENDRNIKNNDREEIAKQLRAIGYNI